MRRRSGRISARSLATRWVRCLPGVCAALLVVLLARPELLAEPNAGAAPDDVEALMARFERVGVVRADFVSTQRITLLLAPLESEGRLYFEPPSTMVRETLHPGVSKVVVEGHRVHVELLGELAAGLVRGAAGAAAGSSAAGGSSPSRSAPYAARRLSFSCIAPEPVPNSSPPSRM